MSSNNFLFEIITRTGKEDYRKFSYISIFKKKFKTISLIILLAGVASAFAVFLYGNQDPMKFLLYWLGFTALAFGTICAKVELKVMRMTGMAQVGLISQKEKITFYENYLVADNGNVKNAKKIKYDDLFQILDSKDYYIIYANSTSASLIRKRDVEEEDRDEFKCFLQKKLGGRYVNIS